MKTIDRKTLVSMLAQGAHPEEATKMVEDVLGQLGWARKETFEKDDIPVILVRVAENAQAFMAGQDVPALREMSAGFDQMLAPVKQLIAQAAKP